MVVALVTTTRLPCDAQPTRMSAGPAIYIAMILHPDVRGGRHGYVRSWKCLIMLCDINPSAARHGTGTAARHALDNYRVGVDLNLIRTPQH